MSFYNLCQKAWAGEETCEAAGPYAVFLGLAHVLYALDVDTAHHSWRIAWNIRCLLDRSPELRDEFGDIQKELFFGALVHDLGKAFIDNTVVNRAYRLNPTQLRSIAWRLRMASTLYRINWRFILLALVLINRKRHLHASDKAFLKKLHNFHVDVGYGIQYPLLLKHEYNILTNKAHGNLSQYQFKLIQQHPLMGYSILSNVTKSSIIREIVLKHHEKLDGSGYPLQCTADDIPNFVRFLTVLDIFDALVNDRPYRKALSVEEACHILRKDAQVNKLCPKYVSLVEKHGQEIVSDCISN